MLQLLAVETTYPDHDTGCTAGHCRQLLQPTAAAPRLARSTRNGCRARPPPRCPAPAGWTCPCTTTRVLRLVKRSICEEMRDGTERHISALQHSTPSPQHSIAGRMSAATHRWLAMSTGRSTMWRRPAAWHAVSGASPVIMTSWWLLSASSCSAGSLSVAQHGAGHQRTLCASSAAAGW